MRREWLIQFRKLKKMTQEEVASRAFIDRGYYSQIETGKRDPGINVAQNISKVLDFDPLLFYQDQLNNTPEEDLSCESKLSEFLKSEGKGKILYLYNDLEDYFQKAHSFILDGISSKMYFIIVDYRNHVLEMKNEIDRMITSRNVLGQVHFVIWEDIDQLEETELMELLKSLSRDNLYGIWVHQEIIDTQNIITLLEHSIDSEVMEDLLLIDAFNATKVSAKHHITLMRLFPILMTDYEVVHSPFYPRDQIKCNPFLFYKNK